MVFLYILLAVLAILFILAFLVPKKYHISRSIVITKPKPEVYQYLKLIKNQDHWSPWKKRDPGMEQTFTGTDGTVGFVSKWDSDHKHVGSGEQEITGLHENKSIKSELRFLKPFKSVSSAFIDVEDVNEGTKVIWGFHGVHKMPMNVMMLFYNMDKAVGKDFDEGLASLKKILEK